MRLSSISMVLLFARCDGPTSPSKLNFRPGLNWLTLIGYDIVESAGSVTCTPIAVPPAGKLIMTPVNLALEGEEWVARTSADVGDLELRLHATGSVPRGQAVQGTMRGSAKDVGVGSAPPRDVRVVLTSPQPVTGTLQDVGFLSLGQVTGSITFTDSGGATGSCAAIDWSMAP